MYEDADAIAEYLRSLKLMAIGGVDAFSATKTIKDAPQTATADAFIAALLAGHEAIIKQGEDLIKACQKEGDLVTQDFVIQQVEARKKNAWMLRSLLA